MFRANPYISTPEYAAVYAAAMDKDEHEPVNDVNYWCMSQARAEAMAYDAHVQDYLDLWVR